MPQCQRATGATQRSWRIESDTAHLRPVRQAFEQFVRDGGANERTIGELGLVLNEALANTIRHGYGGDKKQPIEIDASIDNGRLKLTIRDWGKPFDPAAVMNKPKDLLTPGGLGLICMRKIMDCVDFERLGDGMRLTMEKKLA